MKVGILGGGISGLGVAYFLSQSGVEVNVLEKNDRCGGLCQSFKMEEFGFDHGPHILFSRDKEILSFQRHLLGHNIKQHHRNNKVFFKNRFMKYPFENDLAALDVQDRFECLYHYLKDSYPKPTNFKEWIYATFGKGIAEKYLIPYNEKIWNTDPSLMSCDWVEGRIPRPPLEDVLKSALGIQTEGYTHQLNFFYPKKGGIESLSKALEKRLPTNSVVTGYPISQVIQENNQWAVLSGEKKLLYDKLVCAMPVFHFVDALDGTPPHVKEAAKNLNHNATILVLLGLKGDHHTDKFGVYIPDKGVRFHRLSYYRYIGEEYVPSGHSSMQIEMSVELNGSEWNSSNSDLIEQTIQGLKKLELLDPTSVVKSQIVRMPYAYVVYDLNYNNNIDVVYSYFKGRNIPLCGRFAEFKYYNTDMCLRSAHNVATQILGDLNIPPPSIPQVQNDH